MDFVIDLDVVHATHKRFPTVARSESSVERPSTVVWCKTVSYIVNNRFSFRPTAFKCKELRFWVNKLTIASICLHKPNRRHDAGGRKELQTKPEGLRFKCSWDTPIKPNHTNQIKTIPSNKQGCSKADASEGQAISSKGVNWMICSAWHIATIEIQRIMPPRLWVNKKALPNNLEKRAWNRTNEASPEK